MFRSLHRLPSHVVNGIGVTLGIAVTRALLGSVADSHFADLALTGAIYTSLADVPARPGRTAQRVLAAALTGCTAAAVIALLHPHPALLGAGIALVVFLATMMLGWGLRAGPVSFAAVLAVVFTMSLPPGHGVLDVLRAHGAGAAVYLVWAVVASALLQPRYRTLALAAAIDATAALLRTRAAAVASPPAARPDLEAARAWIAVEARLAERLQAARNLLFPAQDATRARRQTALLMRLIDLRDIVLASSVDLDRLGDDGAARAAREALHAGLLRAAEWLDRCRDVVSGAAPSSDTLASAAMPAVIAAPGHPKAAMLAELEMRSRHLVEDMRRIAELAQGADETPRLGASELRQFVAPEGWPLRDLVAQAKPASPVFRHALRAAAALAAAYTIALWLPWSAHPQWLVLSVAVVLRGNLEQTLARRNARVLGTALGCLVVVGLARLQSGAVATAAFLVAVGMAHGFALERYLVTAVAGTVMALLQAHAVAPATGFPIAERLADTLLGAALAWAFSFVLPSWERRRLPREVENVLKALAEYTRIAVPRDGSNAVAQGLARRHAYDALGSLTASLQRIAAEPAAVRPREQALADLLELVDHAQRVMAQVSMLRLMARSHDAQPDHEALRRAVDDAAAALGSTARQQRATESSGGADPEGRIESLRHSSVAAGDAARRALASLAGAGVR